MGYNRKFKIGEKVRFKTNSGYHLYKYSKMIGKVIDYKAYRRNWYGEIVRVPKPYVVEVKMQGPVSQEKYRRKVQAAAKDLEKGFDFSKKYANLFI